MINEITNYRCKCNKCNHLWTTKTFDVPDKCPKCKRVTWNEGSEPAPRIDASYAPQVVEPSNDMQTKLERARAALMSVETKVFSPVEAVEPEWQFTKDAPQYGEDGNVYRKQGMCVSGKWKFRNVQVDENDHNDIVRIV